MTSENLHDESPSSGFRAWRGQRVARAMGDFAQRTGLTGEQPPARYLWTDAFAVCNFIGLYLETRDGEALDLARRLVDQTHRTLGMHRPDDPRSGWISGLNEADAARHPTLGGLRIGKPLPERPPNAVMDARLEWERDGQYFHYLTKWIHALGRMAEVTEERTYLRWAFELAAVAHHCFASGAPEHELHWKMSIDLSRALVPGMGLHDPLDAWVTYRQVQVLGGGFPGFDLQAEIRAMAQVCEGRNWDTDDALGVGGLLWDAWRVVHLGGGDAIQDAALTRKLLDAAARGLVAIVDQRTLEHGASCRLPFREFGLAIGLRATHELLRSWPAGAFPDSSGVRRSLEQLRPFVRLAENIERFWNSPANQATSAWREHRDINEVMYATSLAPEGYLGT